MSVVQKRESSVRPIGATKQNVSVPRVDLSHQGVGRSGKGQATKHNQMDAGLQRSTRPEECGCKAWNHDPVMILDKKLDRKPVLWIRFCRRNWSGLMANLSGKIAQSRADGLIS